MIKTINSLKNFGIFKNYIPSKDISGFKKFNLIYGLNGSGKTTLVALFELLKKKKLPDRFSSAEFSITLEDLNTKITQNHLSNANLNLHIFNNSFITENIDWNNSVKSILLITEEKIEERKNLSVLMEKQEKAIKNKQQIEDNMQNSKTAIEKFMTQTAKSMKQNLQAIDTNDSYFMNYNKIKLKNFMDENEQTIKEKSGVLNETQVKQCIEGAKPNKKDPIILDLPLVNFEKFKTKEKEINGLLNQSVTNSMIERLSSNGDIQSWVEAGLKIHKKHNTNQCEFCGHSLSEERIKQLEGHFNKAFEIFKDELKNTSDSINYDLIHIDNQLPSSEKLYVEYVKDFKEASKSLIFHIEKINNCLEKWNVVIQKKISNPFNTSLVIDNLDQSVFEKLNSYIKIVNNLLKKHNQKTKNFEEETNRRKKDLELHYTTEKVQDFDYYNKEKELKNSEEQLKVLQDQISERKKKIQKLEGSLSNESIGAQKINSSLHKFLGRNNLSLSFNKDSKGYDIIRDQEEQHSQYLSEGEKRAIAFVYFITKLNEKNNEIKDSIVVIDDPMSSLDSNNLFHAYSFLRTHCEKTKQLFVFTHNFTYFKLVRDWFNKKNKNRENEKQPKSPVASFFTVNTKLSVPRNAELENMPESLLKYNSEYHYIFETLFKYKNYNELNINESFMTANLSRKLLESFFYFKYPKHRSDLSSLLESGIKNCTKTTPEIKDKIHNFINKYSHSDKIDINEDTAENLMGESHPIIGDIFKWIEEVDKTHYDEMVEVATSN